MKPYYESGGITIYNADCRDLLSDVAGDAIITDPPYGIDLGNHKSSKDKRPGHLHKGSFASYEDSTENLRNIVVPTVSAYLKKTKRGMVFSAGTKIHEFPEPDMVGGVFVPCPVGRGRWGFHNLVFTLLYGTAADIHNGCRPTAISSNVTSDDNGHPCPKPLTWLLWAVQLGSLPGETVIDPFMGSGTTLRACKDLGRKAIGIEIEEKYCEIAVRRLAQENLFVG